jgi:peptidoglycan/LPS O-acetylase OafA/YrhL
MPVETEAGKTQHLTAGINSTAKASSPKAQRIAALDFIKGALVLIMVLYHWINYFIGPQWKYYPYLRFLTPSFIFITGFMISHVYLAKYSVSDPRLWKRLFTRGVKLLAVFLVLNVARNLVVPLLTGGIAEQNLPSLADIFTIFVSGNLPFAGNKIVSFSILVPISYLLMFSGALVIPYRHFRHTFHLTCLLLLLSIAMLAMSGRGSYYLEFVTIGMIGVLSGFVPIGKLNGLVHYWYLIAFAYLCYTIVVAIWNVPFPVLIVGVILSVMTLYAVGTYGAETGIAKREIILLGKYSLLGYMAQIAILQVLSTVFRHLNLAFFALPVSFLSAFVLTILSVEVVDRTRSRVKSVDRLYKFVFA